MSKHETWRTRKFWSEQQQVGRLHEEFLAVSGDRGSGKRLLDGLILHGAAPEIGPITPKEISDAEITVIQTKRGRLGMYLMGQAYFSREIMRRYQPAKIHTVAICGKGDVEMERLCEAAEIEVWVCPDDST